MKHERTISINQPEHGLFVRTRIQMAIKTVATPGIRVFFRQPADTRFEAAVALGVELATERVTMAGNRRGVEVTVFFLEYEHLGPRSALVTMLVAQCACEALGVAEELAPRLNETKLEVVFPLLRG
ncbi:MAG: hypothetical protein HC927_00805 [Deltaproteobacteria bacterium]|nr:hypothetical protein [Deltaproteobacteria bacterium]